MAALTGEEFSIAKTQMKYTYSKNVVSNKKNTEEK
jgi:hypothetical protein